MYARYADTTAAGTTPVCGRHSDECGCPTDPPCRGEHAPLRLLAAVRACRGVCICVVGQIPTFQAFLGLDVVRQTDFVVYACKDCELLRLKPSVLGVLSLRLSVCAAPRSKKACLLPDNACASLAAGVQHLSLMN
jgi:hypothetical protein